MSHATPELADAVAIAAALAAGATSSVALTQRCLEAIERRETLHAFTYLDAEGALAAAAASDARRARGAAAGPGDGLPVALKANLAVRGWPHTGGYGYLRDVRATEDASVVARLRTGGAVLLGATNMDEGALGATSVNPWYGTTRNPADPACSVGGSSGGSAAAVAAGLCAFALGSDTLGSVRIPAAWCGIAALKPSFAAVSTEGVIPVHARFDHVGPLARRVADLALALALLTGSRGPATPIRPAAMRLGFVRGFESLAPDPAVIAGFEQALERLRWLGHRLEPLDVHDWPLTAGRRAIFALCEVELARRHATRLAQAPDSFSPGLRALLEFGARQTPADVERYGARIAALEARAQGSLRDVEVLLTPTVPTPAVRLDGPMPASTADLTVIASATGLPAISLPVPPAASLPIGIQLIGRRGSDQALLALAGELEAAFDRETGRATPDQAGTTWR